ncbi:MAG: hypothetical protein K6F00_02225 [Lachnospiraceae bacterium]|nr:hypothetical protein [Lachnospiraceae bacterium]
MGGLNVLNGAIGNVDKAVLCIRDIKKVNEIRSKARNPKATGGFDMNIATASMTSLANMAQGGLSAAMKLADGDLSGLLDNKDVRGSLNNSGYIPYTVNYNPESIRLSSTGEGSAGYNNDAGGNSFAQLQTYLTQNVLSFTLIFEAVNVTDAFSIYGQGFNLESVYSLGKNILMGDDEKKRVLNHTQGLLGLLPDVLLQDMIFVWSDMSFRGNLIDMDVEYRMFNMDGDPVLATANLKLQALATNETDADREYWKTAKSTLFKGKNTYDSRYRSADGGKLSELLS